MSRTAVLAVFAALALPAALPRAALAPPVEAPALVPRAALAPPVEVTCTFANASYAGDCVEKATRKEKEKPAAVCRPILECLNNPHCAKSYCQATTIRQGWTLKAAE